MSQDHNDIVWQTVAAHTHDIKRGPLVVVRSVPGQVEGERTTEVFLYATNHPNLFAATVAALDQLGLTVLAARVHSSERIGASVRHICFSTYSVAEQSGEPVSDDGVRFEAIRAALTTQLREPSEFSNVVSRRVPRTLRHFPIATEVTITPPASDHDGAIQVIAADRPGLLARLGHVFMELGLSVHQANITTLGERVEDVFFVSAAVASTLTDPGRIAELTTDIEQRLDAMHQALDLGN